MELIDLTGETFGRWIVLGRSDKATHWLCRCDCGKEKPVRGADLRKGTSRQCRECWRKSKSRNLAGCTLGRWSVLTRDGKPNYWLCRCQCGAEQSVSTSHLRFGGGAGCKACWKKDVETEDLTGRQFGKWTALTKEYRGRLIYWRCRCECGRDKSVYGTHLTTGKSLSCRKCSDHKHKGRLDSRIWNRMLYLAKERNISVDLGEPKDAKVFLYDLLHNKQACICALSGLPIRIANTIKGGYHGETTASIDRIDSKKGYTRDNVQWVHKWINRMKWNLDQEEFITFCEAVVNYKGKR